MEVLNTTAPTMSNYSVYFLLQNNGLDLNCSVYLLTLGLLSFADLYTDDFTANITNFLPAYYVTNCLMEKLAQQILSLSLSASNVLHWVHDFKRNPYNVSDNGDSFVALLFTISGLCVSCWMLMLIFLLLPKYKRKPALTQVATLLYLVVLTALLARITEVARDEYYADLLDMIKILGIVNEQNSYQVAVLVLQALTACAFMHLVLKMTPLRWKRPNGSVGAVLIVAYIIVAAIAQSEVDDYSAYISSPALVCLTLQPVCKLLLLTWFSGSLLFYTVWGTASSPREVSYLRKLIPLAIVTWTMVATHFVLTLLSITHWRDTWLVTSWIIFLPYLLEMYLLTCTWEWFFSIRDLELRRELVGMLGRRISLEDVMNFSHPDHQRRARSRFASVRDFFWPKESECDVKDIPSVSSSSKTFSMHTPSGVTTQEVDLGDIPLTEWRVANEERRNEGGERRNGGRERRNEGENGNVNRRRHDRDADDDDASTNGSHQSRWEASDNTARTEESPNSTKIVGVSTGANTENGRNTNIADSDSEYSYEVEYVDNSEIWDTDHQTRPADEGTSRDLAGQDEIPAFRPLPGFHADDYWDDK